MPYTHTIHYHTRREEALEQHLPPISPFSLSLSLSLSDSACVKKKMCEPTTMEFLSLRACMIPLCLPLSV